MDTKIWLWLYCLITLLAILLPLLVFFIKKINNASLPPSAPPLNNTSVTPLNNSSVAPTVPSLNTTSSLPTSSPAGRDYEVFLSFRGADTRKTFTDYLYHDLVEAGIRTYRDDNELRIGENISDELLEAIQHSKISIPVFSKDYASSKWCLLELTKMVECKTTLGRTVKPIFYDVKPSDVRNQTGSYEMAFQKHEKKYDSAIVEGWKKALREVGELKGWEVADR